MQPAEQAALKGKRAPVSAFSDFDQLNVSFVAALFDSYGGTRAPWRPRPKKKKEEAPPNPEDKPTLDDAAVN